MKQVNIFDLLDLKIPYRNNLNFNCNVTFGIEIEFQFLDLGLIKEIINLKHIHNWNVKKDGTITKEINKTLYGGEISSPILIDSSDTYDNIKKVCNLIELNGGIAGDLTGAHIHVGHQILNFNIDYWKNLVLLWIAFEKVIMRFAYGKTSIPRNKLHLCSNPVGKDLLIKKDKLLKCNDLISFIGNLYEICGYKESSIDFSHITGNDVYNETMGNSTIEIRCPNGTLDPIIWQNNINFFISLLNYANSKKFDTSLMEYIIMLRGTTKDINDTTNIYNEEAIILSNLIFDKEIDKLYFLKQYYKAFNEKDLINEIKRSKVR